MTLVGHSIYSIQHVGCVGDGRELRYYREYRLYADVALHLCSHTACYQG
jgi:hypothetical protein